MAEVKANLARRNGCSRHLFEARDSYRLGDRLTCANCGTAMRLSEIGLYARGFMAAGGNPDDILAGLSRKPRHDRARPLDQLCHADVLLRLANEVAHSAPARQSRI